MLTEKYKALLRRDREKRAALNPARVTKVDAPTSPDTYAHLKPVSAHRTEPETEQSRAKPPAAHDAAVRILAAAAETRGESFDATKMLEGPRQDGRHRATADEIIAADRRARGDA